MHTTWSRPPSRVGGRVDPRRDRGRVADVEAPRAAVDLDRARPAGSASSAIAAPMPFVPPTTSIAGARQRSRLGGAARRVGSSVRIWSIRSAMTMSIRVVILRLTSSPATATIRAPGHVAQDEAAVVGGGQVAGGRRRRVRPGEHAGPERLGRLAAAVAALGRGSRRPGRPRR